MGQGELFRSEYRLSRDEKKIDKTWNNLKPGGLTGQRVSYIYDGGSVL